MNTYAPMIVPGRMLDTTCITFWVTYIYIYIYIYIYELNHENFFNDYHERQFGITKYFTKLNNKNDYTDIVAHTWVALSTNFIN